MKRKSIQKFTNYFLLTFLIATAGFPFFYSDIEYVVLGFLISFYIFIKRKLGYNKRFRIIIVFFFLIEILQTVYFNTFEPKTFIGTFIRLGFAYYTVAVLGKNFFDYFFKIIYFFSVISLVFFIPSIINNSFASFFVNNLAVYFHSPFETVGGYYIISPNIILYVFEKSLFISSRNSGPFWEPGAFAVFIILAMMFKLIQTHRIQTFKIIVLSIVLLTTTSTSGYIALFLLFVLHYALNKKVKVTKYFLIAIIVYGAGLLYLQLDFLGAKASEDIALASETTTSRFGSALVDLKDFSKNPIIGYGRGSNRYGGKTFKVFTEDMHRNNGLTQLLVTYGIIIFIMYFIMYYKTLLSYCRFHNFNSNFAWAGIFIIMLLGFSQGLFTRPFFYALLFVSYDKYQIKRSYI